MAKSASAHDVIIAIAKRKAEAARTRRIPSLDVERPRDVILAACQVIAENLQPEGFEFLKSGPRLKRSRGDLTCEIFFQSDRNNIAGRRAAVWIHAGVSSKSLARWRRSRPMPWGGGKGPQAGLITGGQIGNLVAEPGWMEWDFADASTRAAEIEDAVSTIRRIILPFFALFDEPATAVDMLIHRLALWQPSLLEYAIAVLDRKAAEKAGRSYLRCNPRVQQDFIAALEKFARDGLPAYRSGVGSDLATLAIAANLDLSGEA